MQENKQCQNEFSTINIQDKSILELFQLLNEGENATCNLRPFKEATLVFGNTGSGKTTFTRRIAGYGTTLRSVFDMLDYKIISSSSTVNSESFINSNTTFPEQILDKSTGAVYYDFPGFKDTRGSAHDIATTYFIKKIIDNIEQVKMLVLINYVSLTEQGTRDDFTSILLHVTKFVKNIEKYKDGVALIVTKVPYPKSQDDVIIASLAKFIEKVERDLKNKKDPFQDYSDAIKLINIILQKEGNIYPKIGISRSPDEEGLLSEIPLLKTNVEKIKTKLAKLKFVKKDDTDFGYIIPKQSLIDVSNLINQINDSITANVREIGKEIQKYLSAEEDRTHDIARFFNFTSIKYNELEKTKEKANIQAKTEKCIQEVLNGVASFNTNSAHQNMLIRYGNYTTFLHQVSDNAIDNKFKCADGLQDVIKYSLKLKKLYHFMDNLYERLSNYDIQNDVLNSACTVFATHTIRDIRNKANDEFKFNQPDLRSCYPKYESQLGDINDVTIDKPGLNALEKILNSTMMNNTHYSCDADKLVIKGHFLKLTDITDLQKKACSASPKFIEMLALNEIFINADLDKTGEQVQLSIVAPVWNIRGSRKITLDGKSGEAHDPRKASDGDQPGNKGSDGLPGLPGGPGGNFLGIGDIFKNLQGLTISIRGGNGGPGQNGGNGRSGKNGEDATKSKIRDSGSNWKNYWHVFAGEDGGAGGNGGHGGAAGLGAHSGNIIFVPFSSSDMKHLHTVTGNGSDGTGGYGGEGSVGGTHGSDLKVTKPKYKLYSIFGGTKTKKIYRDGRAPSGVRGYNGYNNNARKNPEKSRKISNVPYVVNEYKTYAMRNLQQCVRESYMTEFLQKLENDERLKNQPQRRRRFIDHADQTQAIYHENVPLTNNFKTSRILMALEPDTSNADNTSAKSAGVRINSPINFAVNLVGSFIGQWKLFSAASIFNYGLIKGGIEFMFGDSKPSDIHTTAKGNTNHTIQQGNFNVNESLMLANFAIRCITKEKFYNCKEKSMNSTEVKASVLNIITEFEKILKDVSVLHNLPPESLEFDPVTLISKLEKEIINQNYKKMENVLYQSVEGSFRSNNPQFHAHLLQKIDEILVSRNNADLEDHQINRDHLQSNRSSNVIGIENCNKFNVYQLEMNNFQSFEEIGS